MPGPTKAYRLEKIIRKKLEDSEIEITPDNYKEKITDLIGVRALHLFKEDWAQIHDFVSGTWSLHEKPTANVRKGDSEEYTQQFVERGCRINEHKYGYRSVHYLIESQPAKELFITELQVRTIFEEGWSEIDHRIRYPYDLDNAILTQLSAIHNRLAGSADEIGSFIKILKGELKARDEQMAEAIDNHAKAVNEVNAYVQKLEISNKKKKELEERVQTLSSGGYSLYEPNITKAIQAMSRTLVPSSAVMNALDAQSRIMASLAAATYPLVNSGAVARASKADAAIPPAHVLPSTSTPSADAADGQPTADEVTSDRANQVETKSASPNVAGKAISRRRGRRTKSASKQKRSKKGDKD